MSHFQGLTQGYGVNIYASDFGDLSYEKVFFVSATIACLGNCPDFGWDRVDFLPSSWYSAVFWI